MASSPSTSPSTVGVPSPPQVLLDSDALVQLNSPDARALLDTIDSLRELQVGEIVNLPQIIVVGDQSSGKSSVLEAISRVRFPVDGDLCTRFATELVLRRASESSVNVRIQFAENRPFTAGEPSQQPFRRSGFDKDALPDIIREAKELLGITTGNSRKRFSNDILRVEIAGPDVYPLTLVDLPGIFHSATADQDMDDMRIVNQLIENYMRQPKSIILAVVAANNQLANQAVLREAKKHDPNRERTIGVITKPDLAGAGSANERKYLDLVKGREAEHKLALGWYVLRNRSENERSIEAHERDAKEESFFQTGAWRYMAPTNRGIESLRKRLSKVLLDHIKTSLPGLVREIEESLSVRQESLDRLGKSRSSTEELRAYLVSIAQDYQKLARDAVEGRYNDKFFGDVDEVGRKLRAVLRNLNRAFDVILTTKGARYKIEWETPVGDIDSDEDEDDDDEIAAYQQSFISMYNFPDPEIIKESALNTQLKSWAAANQGKELPGEPNRELVFLLFKQQAERWQEISQFHLDQALNFSKAFVEQVFVHVIGTDETTIQAILKGCVDPFFNEKRDVLKAKLRELFRPYSHGYGLPLEKEFHKIMSRRTLERLANQLTDTLAEEHPDLFQSQPNKGLSPQKILRAVLNSEQSSSVFGTEKVIDMMETYYDMALRTFIDNVINLAVESCLVSDIPNILAPTKVNGMSPERLIKLAAETEEVQSERQLLEEQANLLREALSKCQQHKHRELTVLPSNLSRLSVNGGSSRPASREPTPSPAPTPVKQAVHFTPNLPTTPGQTANAPAASSNPPKPAAPAASSVWSTPAVTGGFSGGTSAFKSNPFGTGSFGGNNNHSASTTGSSVFGGSGLGGNAFGGGFGQNNTPSASSTGNNTKSPFGGSFNAPTWSGFSTPSFGTTTSAASAFGASTNTSTNTSGKSGFGGFTTNTNTTTTPASNLFGGKPVANNSTPAKKDDTINPSGRSGDPPSKDTNPKHNLTYPGILAVPLVHPSPSPWPTVDIAPLLELSECLWTQHSHICLVRPECASFSPEELRLKWMQAGGAKVRGEGVKAVELPMMGGMVRLGDLDRFESLCAMEEFRGWSPEELRLRWVIEREGGLSEVAVG